MRSLPLANRVAANLSARSVATCFPNQGADSRLPACQALRKLRRRSWLFPWNNRRCWRNRCRDRWPTVPELSEGAEIEEAESREREIETGQVQPISEAEFWKKVEASRRR